MTAPNVLSPAYAANGCTGKLRYRSKADAKRAAKWLAADRGGRPCNAYRCLVCDGFHIGHGWTPAQVADWRSKYEAAG